MISFFNDDIEIPKIPKRKTSKWIKSVAKKYNKRVGDISYIFCSDKKILEINKKYLNHEYFTDIITFDYSKNNIVSGDIFISVDTVRSNAEKFGELFQIELNRVIIHGILHLCEIDDKTKNERLIMENQENEALDMLKQNSY